MDPNRIQGDVQRPYNAQEPEKKDNIDPEKFKKVMKVDESDETQKRHKRNLKKEEEEGEEEKTEEAPAPVQGAFSEFMSDKEELDNILSSKSGGIRRQTASENPPGFKASPPKPISTEGVELTDSAPSNTQDLPPPPQYQSITQKAPQETQNTQAPDRQPLPPSSSNSSTTPPVYDGLEKDPLTPRSSNEPIKQNVKTDAAQPSNQTPTHSENSNQKDSQSDPKKPHKKKKHDDSLLASQPQLSDLKALKKKKRKTQPLPEEKLISAPKKSRSKTSKVPEKVASEKTSSVSSPKKKSSKPSKAISSIEKPDTSSLAVGKKKKDSIEAVKGSPIAEETAKHTDLKHIEYFQKASPQEIRKKKIGATQHKEEEIAGITGAPISGPGEGESMDQKGGEKKDSKEDVFVEASALTASIPLPASIQPLPTITPSDAIPAYSKLSSEVYELFEKMGGVLMVQQHSGDEKSTMTINKPDSIFNGSQITLTRYSTAPNAFNIQFEGNSKSVETFQKNIQDLQEAFKQANYDFETNILTPRLHTNKKSPHLISRKGSAGGKGSGGDQRQPKG